MNSLDEDEKDAWPDEPDEFDPDSLGPEIPDTTPTLRESLDKAEDVSDELFRAFWASVLFLNLALAALAIGAMFIYFRGDYETGGAALLIGTVAAVATIRYYWGAKNGRYTDTETQTETEPETQTETESVGDTGTKTETEGDVP